MKKQKNKYIIVNATALRSGGALTILKEFIVEASLDNNKYMVFLSKGTKLPHHDNIVYVYKNTNSWIKRILWDFIGLSYFLKKNEIQYDLVFSLQNTSINVNSRQVIYIHQALPFIDTSWSINTREKLILYLYKKYYHIFIFAFSKSNTKYIVQSYWIKEILFEKYKISKDNIFVVKPESCICYNEKKTCQVLNETFRIFYPASPLFYKNHDILFRSLLVLKDKYKLKNIELILTVDVNNKKIKESVNNYGLNDNVRLIGEIPYDKVINEYNKCDLMTFPSYIETFGLPLVEAAKLGKIIIASDLPYSREVLNSYNGAIFSSYDNEYDWAEKIYHVYLNRKNYKNYRYKVENKFNIINCLGF